MSALRIIAGPLSVRAVRPFLVVPAATMQAAVAGRPQFSLLSPVIINRSLSSGVGGQQLHRSFHATAAVHQGSNMWNEKPYQFGVVIVPQQMAYVSAASAHTKI